MSLAPDKTKVVLIVNGEFPKWKKDKDIPNVNENLKELKSIFQDFIGIPERNIRSLQNQESSEILKDFQRVCKDCKGVGSTLIVYYAGHGIPIANKGLFWAASDTEGDVIETSSIETKRIKELMRDTCFAENKILIADCCYASDFLKGAESDVGSFLMKNESSISGIFYMFSSDGKHESVFDENDATKPTYFTKALLDAIKEGQENENEYFTIGDVYGLVVSMIEKLRNIEAKYIPEPRKSTDGNVDQFIFCRNNKYKMQPRPDEVEWAEIVIDQYIDKERIEKIKKFIKSHTKSPYRKEAVQMLIDYESAEKGFKNVKLLSAEERKVAYLNIAKESPYPDLVTRAMESYESENSKEGLEQSDKNKEGTSIRDSIQGGSANSAPRLAGLD